MERRRIEIASRADVEAARRAGRDLAVRLGFDSTGAEECALVVSELGANLVRYAQRGEITLSILAGAGGAGIEIVSADRGPGIADIELAMKDGFSTGGGLGGGLPGIKRLMDEVRISTGPDGTRIVARKWPSRR